MKQINKMSVYSKRAQDIFQKKGQEEMLGFALIMILVAVILVIFLGFSLRSPQKEALESYEVDSFIQAFLSYTTECGNYRESHLSIRELLFDCNSGEKCLDREEDACDVLNSTLTGIVEEAWKIEGDRPIKGYKLEINVGKGDEYDNLTSPIIKGNVTGNSKGSGQDFSKGGNLIEIFFTAYY